jgi:hypothetical protein
MFPTLHALENPIGSSRGEPELTSFLICSSLRYNARLTEQIFDGGFLRLFAKKVTAKICPVQPIVIPL